MWTWIFAFAGAASLARHDRKPDRSLIAFAAIASGAVGCVAAGRWADALGRRGLHDWRSHERGLLGCGRVLLARRRPALPFASVWGFSVVADSAQFSALVSEHSVRTHVGTAHAADLGRLSADDREHPAAAVVCGAHRMAMGVSDAGAGCSSEPLQ